MSAKHTVVKTKERVGDGRPSFVSVSRWRAERWARERNAEIIFPSYRYEVVQDGRRWHVVAFQNRAVPK